MLSATFVFLDRFTRDYGTA